jgi:Cdc6-like AAA superfamily ATPase
MLLLLLLLPPPRLLALTPPPLWAHRADEGTAIRKFLLSALERRPDGLIKGGAMYIAGLPGTGKSATVRHALKAVRAKDKGRRFRFDVLEVRVGREWW